jgi:hypothetical protein
MSQTAPTSPVVSIQTVPAPSPAVAVSPGDTLVLPYSCPYEGQLLEVAAVRQGVPYP